MIKKYKDIILYLIFGVLTTLVNWLVYFPLANLLKVNYIAADVIAWVAAVAFAFVTNRTYVFHSERRGTAIAGEAAMFAAARVFSLLCEIAVMALGIDLLGFNENLVKIAAAVLVVILNYVFSKLIVFKRKEKH